MRISPYPCFNAVVAAGRCLAALAALLLPAMSLVFGCRSDVGKTRQERLPRIAVVGEALSDPAYSLLEGVCQTFVDENPSLMIELMAPRTPSPALQRKMLDDMDPSDFAAVCIMPTDPVSLAPALERLTRRGLPTVVIGRDAPESARFAYCGPSEAEIGEAAARACRRALRDEKSTIIVLAPEARREPYTTRLAAFHGAFIRAGSEAKILEVGCPESPIDSLRVLRNEARKFPRVGCWVLLDDWPLRMLSGDEKLAVGDSAVVLCHPGARHLDRVRRWEITALIGYDLHIAAEKALTIACEAMRQPEVLRSHIVESRIVTRSEVSDYERAWGAAPANR